MLTIDLSNRIYAAFGYLPSGMPHQSVIKQNIMEADVAAVASGKMQGELNKAIAKKNISRFSVVRKDKSFADLTLKSKDKEFKFASTILTEDTPTILAPPPVLSFTRSKNIVKTAVDGSDSEVIECFGTKSWDITISGILVDLDEHSYPSDRVQQIRELFEINDILEVIDCKIMDDLNIQSLYLEQLEGLKFVEGYNDTMSYTLKAKSIKPLEFFII